MGVEPVVAEGSGASDKPSEGRGPASMVGMVTSGEAAIPVRVLFPFVFGV